MKVICSYPCVSTNERTDGFLSPKKSQNTVPMLELGRLNYAYDISTHQYSADVLLQRKSIKVCSFYSDFSHTQRDQWLDHRCLYRLPSPSRTPMPIRIRKTPGYMRLYYVEGTSLCLVVRVWWVRCALVRQCQYYSNFRIPTIAYLRTIEPFNMPQPPPDLSLL